MNVADLVRIYCCMSVCCSLVLCGVIRHAVIQCQSTVVHGRHTRWHCVIVRSGLHRLHCVLLITAWIHRQPTRKLSSKSLYIWSVIFCCTSCNTYTTYYSWILFI